MKRIVICCDGTSNEFGARISNVIKIYKMLKQDDPAQIAYYHPGVGTMGARSALTQIGRAWTKLIGLAFGYGISDNVADAYQFLMNTYDPGDDIYLFGFSRGAYTARCLCGLLRAVGLLRQGNEGQIPYAIRLLKSDPFDVNLAQGFKETFSIDCKPYFVGLWDTVSSVGWVYNAVHFPYTTATSNEDFTLVRHAMSIDERRAFFRQNSFRAPKTTQQDVREVWFAGDHSDVGGSYPESESQLSQIALRWMVCEAERAGLVIDAGRKAEILGGQPPYEKPDPLTTNQHESLQGAWWIAEFWPKIIRKETAPHVWKKTFRVNLGRRRFIPPDAAVVHDSVDIRMNAPKLGYKPGNLPTPRGHLGDSCGV